MADQPNITVSGDSKEAIAYALFLGIARHEKKNIYFASGSVVEADAAWVLTTYRKCLLTVHGQDV